MQERTRKGLTILIALAVVLTSMAAGVFADNASGKGMVAIGSREELVAALQHLEAVNSSINNYYSRKYPPIMYDMAMPADAVPAPQETTASNQVAEAPVTDFSQTNVQVQGVDEGDIVKTDGNYLYQIIDGRIAIARIYPASDLNLVSRIDPGDKNFYPTELYVEGDRLLVVGSSYYGYETNYYADYLLPTSGFTKVLIYNIADRSNPSLLKEMDLEGYYLSSRKVGDVFYFAANKYYYGFDENNLDEMLPHYRLGSGSTQYTPIAYNRIGYFENSTAQNFLTLGAINISDPSYYDVSAYLGSGEVMYMSKENMYIASQQMDIVWTKPVEGATPGEISDIKGLNTDVYKFDLNGASTAYQNMGTVQGTVLNQWSMDENNGNFRIATTNHDADWWWWNAEDIRNNVYVLDGDMNTIGKLEGLAPGEQIYSTLFMGKRLYMVTFRQVDPFFVIDLSTPSKPEVLGKLKIPGFSNYLYPYDDTHIIGFGKETADQYGGVVPTGMKVGLFDVSDVDSPHQISSTVIGDRGTYSELLNNHKALFFNRSTGLLAFPVTVMETKGENNDEWVEYGTFAYQGAYFYKVDLNGIHFQYRLTHLTDKDYDNADSYYYSGSNRDIQRILYVNDIIYTVSDAFWMASDLNSFTQLNKMSTNGVPVPEPVDGTSPNPSSNIRVIVDGAELVMDEAPMIQNGTILVPLRSVFEALGAQLIWNGDDSSILATAGLHTVRMVVGSTSALVDGLDVTMEVPPTVSGTRVLTPLRFSAESLGATAEWNPENQTATITSR